MFSSIDLCILRDACHKLFCVFGDFYAPGTQDAEVTKSLGEAYWSDFVNFHCVQLSLVRSMWFIFEIIKVTHLVHRIFYIISIESRPLVFMYLHMLTHK